MRGRRDEFTIQRLTTTQNDSGGVDSSGTDVATFKGHIREIPSEEQVRFSKDSVFSNFRLYIDYDALSSTARGYLTEGNRIIKTLTLPFPLGRNDFNIKAVRMLSERLIQVDLLALE